MSDSKSRYKRLRKRREAPINAEKGKEVSESFTKGRKGNQAISKGWDYVTGAMADTWDSLKRENSIKHMKKMGEKNKNKKYDPNSSRDCEKCKGKGSDCQC